MPHNTSSEKPPARTNSLLQNGDGQGAANVVMSTLEEAIGAIVQAAVSEPESERLLATAAEGLRMLLNAVYAGVMVYRPGAPLTAQAATSTSARCSEEFRRAAVAAAERLLASQAPVVEYSHVVGESSRPAAVLAAPIFARTGRMGAVVVIRSADGGFTPQDRVLAELVAGILAAGIQRIHTDHLALSQWAALRRTAATLAGRPELHDFLAQILTVIGEEMAATCVVLWLYNAQHDTLSIAQVYERAGSICPDVGAHPDAVSFRTSDMPLWKRIVKAADVILFPDVDADPALRARVWLVGRNSRAMLMVPLTTSEQMVGCITIGADAGDYPPEDLLWLRTLAQQATLAVHLATLAEQSRRAAILEERNRMAREIHDTLAQGFTGILMQIEALEDRSDEIPSDCLTHLAKARELARSSLAEARRSVWSLRLHALEGYDLAGAFTRLIGQMTVGAQAAASFRVHGVPRPLPSDTEAHILRIGLEALTNAIKHAAASRIRINLTFRRASVRLSVRDDGKGFEVSDVPSGFGLAGMRERAHCIGAKLAIRSKPGEGTSVVLEVPIPNGEKHKP